MKQIHHIGPGDYRVSPAIVYKVVGVCLYSASLLWGSDTVAAGIKSAGMPINSSKVTTAGPGQTRTVPEGKRTNGHADGSVMSAYSPNLAEKQMHTKQFAQGYNASQSSRAPELKGETIAFKQGYLAGVNKRLSDILKRTDTASALQ